MAFKMKKPSLHEGTDGHKKAVSDLYKKQVGPVATEKPSKEVAGDVDLDPGFEDPIKIQKVQREGLTPGSQTFVKKKSPNKSIAGKIGSRVAKGGAKKAHGKISEGMTPPKGEFDSPAKQGPPGGDAGEAIDHWKKYKAKKPVKQKIDHVGRTVDKLHSTEKSTGELKKSRAKDIKKVKGKTVKISKKDVLKQMKKAGTKLPYSSVKNALKTSIKAAGKVAKFIPGVAGLVLGATKTATADQPKFKKGDVHYQDPKKKIDFSKKK